MARIFNRQPQWGFGCIHIYDILHGQVGQSLQAVGSLATLVAPFRGRLVFHLSVTCFLEESHSACGCDSSPPDAQILEAPLVEPDALIERF